MINNIERFQGAWETLDVETQNHIKVLSVYIDGNNNINAFDLSEILQLITVFSKDTIYDAILYYRGGAVKEMEVQDE